MAEPTIEEIAKIIGRSPTDLCEDGCDAACETDGGTCICAELHSTAATAILTRFRKSAGETAPTPSPSAGVKFMYDVRAALGMNDKCGLTGLERDVATVRRIALRLRAALIAINDTRGKPGPEEYVDSGTSYRLALAAWAEGQKAIAEAQFPNLWDNPTTP